MIFNRTEKEEKAYLMDIIALLAANIEQMDKAIEDKSKDVMEHKLYLWENLSELDRAEKSAVRQIVTQQVAASESLAEKKKRYRKMMAIPYFGRIDFQEKGQPEVLPLYIGIHSFFNPPTNENLIHDWRAPISSMFYDYELGEAHFDAPSGEVKGNIRLKRQYRIRDGKMEFMLESSLNIQDDILQKELSGNSDDRMKNIVATIQREQNKIIRNDTSNTLIIQGVAGSGKTSIALHRVAYLLYRHKGEITSNDILIISPNKVFADYISNVLPELGEEKIEECGFEELMLKILDNKYKIQTFFDQVAEILDKEEEDFIERIRFKSTTEFIQQMDKYILYLEQNAFRPTDLKAGRIPIPAEYLKERFAAWHRLPMRSRFQPMAEEIARELTFTYHQEPMGKIQIRQLGNELKKMFNNKDLDLYKGFYDWLGKPEMFKQGKNRKLEYADVAPLLYLKLALEDNKTMYGIKHLLVDEMQDYTPIQYKVLAKLFPCRKTILGDAKQSVNPYSSTTCEQIQRVLVGSEVMKLCKSYRSTYEITEFAQRIAKNEELEPIERHGEEPAVALLPTEKKEIEWIENLITSFLKGADVSMGIICKTVKQADKLYAAINHLSDKICLLTEESVAFVNGVVITTAHMAKGLEFDEVIVPFVTDKDYRTEIDRSMLYVACTRAMHKLYISASGNISTFLS